MSEYTKGKWRLHDMEFATVVSDDGRAIALCTANRPLDEQEANARAITAVPNLIDALEKLMAFVEDNHLRNSPIIPPEQPTDLDWSIANLSEAASKALAKAKGEL